MEKGFGKTRTQPVVKKNAFEVRKPSGREHRISKKRENNPNEMIWINAKDRRIGKVLPLDALT